MQTPAQPADLSALLHHWFAAASAHDEESMLSCLAPEARVQDEGQEYVGSEAIRGWIRHTTQKYQPVYRVKHITIHGGSDSATVVAEVTGTFPGSPADLDFDFGLGEGRITSLVIG